MCSAGSVLYLLVSMTSSQYKHRKLGPGGSLVVYAVLSSTGGGFVSMVVYFPVRVVGTIARIVHCMPQ